MYFSIREIDKRSPVELELVTRRCMTTVLETIPDFQGSEENARARIGNFSFGQMSKMIEQDFSDPSKKIMVAEARGEIVGQALFSIKVDNDGKKYGFFYSRYITPNFRRQGIASALMEYALKWFSDNGATYAVGQTHLTNTNLQNLFVKFGFEMSGPLQGPA